MRERAVVGGLMILRPLLAVRGAELREYLRQVGQPWREDSSNASGKYLRNRLRRFLVGQPELTVELLRLAEKCRELRRWLSGRAPRLGPSFAIGELADLPGIIARTSARRWLAERGVGRGGSILPKSIGLLIAMAADAATPPRQQLSRRVTVRRRRGRISAEIAEA
jgi:hypothetical protein